MDITISCFWISRFYAKDESKTTRRLMKFNSDQHPIGIQIFGYKLEDLAYAAKECEQMGADFVDLNFGCPVKKVVGKGAGSAILKDLEQMQKVLRTVKTAVDIPVTIKIRTGWDANSKNSIEVAQLAYDEGIEWVAIHGRTRAQSYTGEADWKYISENGHLPEIPNEAHVTENGINLGEMDAKLLQKIEELTLYMIDMKKRLNQIENENQKLKEEISRLKS